LVGDHSFDTYSKSDIELFVHCLRFLPPSASDRDIRAAGGLLAFLETQVSLGDGKPVGDTMGVATITDGFLAVIRPIFRNNSLEDRKVDPIGLISRDYKAWFAAPRPRESFGDAFLRDVVLEGVQRKSLAFTMLPIMGFLTTRRLAVLVGLMGKDIQRVYAAYDNSEHDVYAAKTSSWLDEDGNAVTPSEKNIMSKNHFVLHDLFREIGFIEWARSLGKEHVFQSFQNYADHESKSSKVMSAFLKMMGATDAQVFHSFRHMGLANVRAKMRD
jgi:hypothetical protein